MSYSWNLLVALTFLERSNTELRNELELEPVDGSDLELSAGANWSWNLLVSLTFL